MLKVKANSFHIPLKNKSIQAVITSPPYWSMRKYDIPEIILGGDENCNHQFDETIIKIPGYHGSKRWQHGGKFEEIVSDNIKKYSYCVLCGAWRGYYGLEGTMELFIEHSLLWIKEIWRVLRDDGVFFLNIGDTYGGSWQNYKGENKGYQRPADYKPPYRLAKPKCKLMIPQRIAISMINDGWILRNNIVWHKPNALSESCRDRFSKKFEYIYFFTKKTRYYFDLDAVKIERKIKEDRPDVNNLKNPGDLWSINVQQTSDYHFASFPEKLVERMILCSSRPDDIILDPFVGTGTTAKVAVSYGRKFIGLDLGYFDIQKKKTRQIQLHLSSIIN